MVKSGIYKITNLINKKIYIGSAVDLNKRKREHFSTLKVNTHFNDYLQRSFNKYGIENFKWEILEFCDPEKCIGREQYYLDTLLFASEQNTKFNKLGYNICRVAGSLLGTKRTEEQRKRMSENSPFTGTKQSSELIEKRISSLRNIKRPKEVGDKISKSRQNIIFTETHKQNISKNSARRGKPGTFKDKKHTEESLDKMSKSIKNIPKQTCIYCNKESTPSKIARWHNENCLENPNINKDELIQKRKSNINEETIQKMSKSISEAKSKPEVKAKHKATLEKQPFIICPHCQYQSKNKGSLIVSHFDNCKQNPNYDPVKAAEKLQAGKDKAKLALDKRPLQIYPHCNHESYNKGWMVRFHFNNCKSLKVE